MLTNILPNNERTQQLQEALASVMNRLYFVGSNARNYVYSFPMTDTEFHFVLSPEAIVPPELAKVPGYKWADRYHLEFSQPTAKVLINRMRTVDEYILSAGYAGEAFAMHVLTGRILCMPEYLTVAPTGQIRDDITYGMPDSPSLASEEASKKALADLTKFENATKELAATIQR